MFENMLVFSDLRGGFRLWVLERGYLPLTQGDYTAVPEFGHDPFILGHGRICVCLENRNTPKISAFLVVSLSTNLKKIPSNM